MTNLHIEIESMEHFRPVFNDFRNEAGFGWWFRGHADATWDLVPTAGREEFYLPDDRDLGRFYAWKQDVYPYLERTFDSDFEALAYAQHHGLATRLLDWTGNPLVAAYFATRHSLDLEGVIYCYSPEIFVDIDTASPKQENLHGAGLVTRAFDNRMLNQKGFFTLHSPPNLPLKSTPLRGLEEVGRLVSIKIKPEIKAELAQQIQVYGIDESFIFPDVDGVSRYVNKYTKEMAARRTR